MQSREACQSIIHKNIQSSKQKYEHLSGPVCLPFLGQHNNNTCIYHYSFPLLFSPAGSPPATSALFSKFIMMCHALFRINGTFLFVNYLKLGEASEQELTKAWLKISPDPGGLK